MRSALVIAVLAGCAAASAGQEKKPAKVEDSPVVAATRKKLQTTISVDFKDSRLEDCLKEIETQTELKFRYDTGVSRNQSLSFTAKDQTVKEILSGMFKGRGLGFVVHRKQNANDRYEGYVDIVQGDQRGDETTPKKEGKAEPKAKPDKTPPKTDTPAAGDGDAQEKAAASKLKAAKVFVSEGQPNDARDYLEELLKKYPKSKAAVEAKELLEKLKK